MNIVSPGSPWWTMTEPRAAEAGARRRDTAWRMLSGSVKKMATRSRIWKRLRSSSGEPVVPRSLSLTPEGIIGLGSAFPRDRLLPIHGEVAPKAPEGLEADLPVLPIHGEVAPKAPEGLESNSMPLVDLAAAGPVV